MRGKGQTFLEFMAVFGGIAAALIGMQVYLQRAMEGRLRFYSEQVSGEKFYSPGSTLARSTQQTLIRESSDTTSDLAQSSAQASVETRAATQLFSYGAEPRR
jgi:hypothetical protein